MRKFSTFFKTNYSLVVAVAANRLSSRQDGEEIATAAFQIAWERYQKGGALDTRWLYGVVRNLVGTEYRKRDRQERLRKRLSEDLDTQLTDLAEPELYSDIRDAVERLPPQYREVIMMTYWKTSPRSRSAKHWRSKQPESEPD